MTSEAHPAVPPAVWFITGCSTGLGRALAQAAIAQGLRVVATARQPETLADIVRGHEESAIAIALDLTKPEQITAAVREAERRFGAIDVLVNNAGYGYKATVEEGEEAVIRHLFETNFFGLAALIRAVLPGMRARHARTRCGGHIFNVTSVAGLNAGAGSAYYAASKFAVEGLSESLHKELAPLGLKVTVVEPGPIRTDFAGRSIKEPKVEIADYDSTSGVRRRQSRAGHGKETGDPARMAAAIIKVAESPTPPLHLILGKPGLEPVRAKLRTLLDEIDAWESVSLSADFPPQP